MSQGAQDSNANSPIVSADSASSLLKGDSSDGGEERGAARWLGLRAGSSGGRGSRARGCCPCVLRGAGVARRLFAIAASVGSMPGALAFLSREGARRVDTLVSGVQARIAADPSFVFKLVAEISQDQVR